MAIANVTGHGAVPEDQYPFEHLYMNQPSPKSPASKISNARVTNVDLLYVDDGASETGGTPYTQ
ncbi:MAG: hypothetical protein ACLQVJ_07715 [Syntrophobacteraceae bacterium]